MRVGIIQSCYIPWRGYFDFIDDVDLFILYDDVKYSHGSWRNRNQIKTENGLKWLTIPVIAGSTSLPIDQVQISGVNNTTWKDVHSHILHKWLCDAPFFKHAMDIWKAGTYDKDVYLSSINEKLTKNICDYLKIKTPIVQSRDYGVTGEKTIRLINLLKKVGATTYLSGPTARGYLEENLFKENGILLEYKAYDYLPYPQLCGGFIGTVSVLDLIANCGEEAKYYLKSKSKNISALTI